MQCIHTDRDLERVRDLFLCFLLFFDFLERAWWWLHASSFSCWYSYNAQTTHF